MFDSCLDSATGFFDLYVNSLWTKHRA